MLKDDMNVRIRCPVVIMLKYDFLWNQQINYVAECWCNEWNGILILKVRDILREVESH